MTYWLTQVGGALVLHIRGELDAVSTPEIREALDELSAALTPATMIADLSELRVIDSSGVGAIVSLYKRVRGNGRSLTVVGAAGQPLAIFRLMRLERVLGIETAPAQASHAVPVEGVSDRE